jgi:hypothetical protein
MGRKLVDRVVHREVEADRSQREQRQNFED